LAQENAGPLPSVDGFGFIFSSNEKGLTSSSNSIYKSINLLGENPDWTLPGGLSFLFDSGVLNANKIFFQAPAADLPASSKIGSGNTWLINPTQPNITAESVTYVRNGNSAPFFRFKNVSASGGRYLIKIDANNNNSYTDSVDVTLNGSLKDGDNKINWNGLNAQGQAIVRPTGGIKTNVKILSSETHFSLSEAENNPGGMIVKRIVPIAQDTDLFYNHDVTSANGFGLTLNGVDSLSGANKWTDRLGDGKVMDSWVYGISQNTDLSV
jgi:large repetitive protein